MKLLKTLLKILLFITIASCANTTEVGDYVAVEKNSQGEKVKVEYAGQCALGVAHKNFKVRGNEAYSYESKDGKIYYFANQEAKDRFLAKRNYFEELADKNWSEYYNRGDFL